MSHDYLVLTREQRKARRFGNKAPFVEFRDENGKALTIVSEKPLADEVVVDEPVVEEKPKKVAKKKKAKAKPKDEV